MPSRFDAPLSILAALIALAVIVQTAPRTPEPRPVFSCDLKGSV